MPLLRAQLRAREPIGVDALRALAREVYGERDPGRRSCTAAGRCAGAASAPRRCSRSTCPNVSKEEIEVTVHGEDLHLRVRDARRVDRAAGSLVGRAGQRRARFADDVLTVDFE